MTLIDPKNKKTIIIVAVIFLALIGLAIYFTVRNKQNKNVVKVNAQLTKVSTETMLFPTLSQDGTKFYYYSNAKDLAFYRQNIDGTQMEKISGILDQPDFVIFSPDDKYAILEVTYDQYKFEKFASPFTSPGTPDQANTTWVYDFSNQKLIRLSDNIHNIIWQKDDRLIYQQISNFIASLNISDADGTNARKITDLPGTQDYGLNILPNGQLVVYNEPSDVSEGFIYTLDLTTKKLQEIKKTDLPSTAIGLSNGQILLSTQTKTSFKLSTINVNGSTKKDFKIQTSLNNFIDLGSDQFVITAAKNNQNNQFILINTKTGKSSVIKDAEADNVNALNFFTSPDKKILYFTSNDILYKLIIPSN